MVRFVVVAVRFVVVAVRFVVVSVRFVVVVVIIVDALLFATIFWLIKLFPQQQPWI